LASPVSELRLHGTRRCRSMVSRAAPDAAVPLCSPASRAVADLGMALCSSANRAAQDAGAALISLAPWRSRRATTWAAVILSPIDLHRVRLFDGRRVHVHTSGRTWSWTSWAIRSWPWYGSFPPFRAAYIRIRWTLPAGPDRYRPIYTRFRCALWRTIPWSSGQCTFYITSIKINFQQNNTIDSTSLGWN
jgi:hypothetical protein